MLPSFPLVPVRSARRRLLRRRLESSFPLQPGHHRPKRKGALEAGMIGARTLLKRQKPVQQREAKYLLEVLPPAAKVEWVLTRLGLQNSKDVGFAG